MRLRRDIPVRPPLYDRRLRAPPKPNQCFDSPTRFFTPKMCQTLIYLLLSTSSWDLLLRKSLYVAVHQRIYVCRCRCVNVCMSDCWNVGVYGCMCVCCLCAHVFAYVCMHACMHVVCSARNVRSITSRHVVNVLHAKYALYVVYCNLMKDTPMQRSVMQSKRL